MKRLTVDIDGVLCEEGPGCDRAYAKPIQDNIDLLSQAAGKDIIIVIHSARPWSDLFLTKTWLDDHGVPYDTIVLGKPMTDMIWDDRASPSTEKVREFIEAA